MNTAIIPARSGSRRIPGKNVRMFAGKPMIAHAIAVARASGMFEHVVVSTDDETIAAVSLEFGAEVPFIRPVELADDHTPTIPVIAHAIRECEAIGWNCDVACCIYPCVPLMQIGDLEGAHSLLIGSGAQYCFPVAQYPSPVQRALRRDAKGRTVPLFPEYELARSQDLEPAYHDAGQFYWACREAWLKGSNIHSNGVGYLIPSWRAVDIDREDDWSRAELVYESLLRKSA